jgi:anti-anti-sigma factor
MTINKELEGDSLIISIEGRIDATSAPELDAVLKTALDNVLSLTFDLSKLDYTSSAGLRSFLKAQKMMDARQGSMVIRGVNELVMEIFEDTGFDNIFSFED